MKIKQWTPWILLAALLLLAGGFATVYQIVPHTAVGDGSHKVEFEVSRGSGAWRVARDLYRESLIDSPDRFIWYLKLTNRSDQLKAGVYSLDDGMTGTAIADLLIAGRTRLIALTIPEGWTNRQIGDYLTEKGFVSDRARFLAIARDRELLKKYAILDDSTEGYLFPETYMVPPGYEARKIQELMLKRFQKVLQAIVAGSGREWSAKEIRDRVVLASIVEREAVRDKERPMMARVFLNRLDKNMRLESCATVQYLLDKPRAKLYERDLQIQSPYNTYRNGGLPPGPVSNPGKAALEAAFQPVENDYLYFVLKPDGSHYFSQSYREHLNAKHKYLD
ncbi:MAG: endolytic transglycosylase MltG [Leptospiraceae bacterium]|nr:endolytic transglycosylase MltG [Leptospiraceae bacterium]